MDRADSMSASRREVARTLWRDNPIASEANQYKATMLLRISNINSLRPHFNPRRLAAGPDRPPACGLGGMETCLKMPGGNPSPGPWERG